MMKYITSLLFLMVLLACKQQAKEVKSEDETEKSVEQQTTVQYPEVLTKVFDAHGGLKNWRSMKNLVYTIPKEDLSEIHTIDLYSRKDRIDTPDYSMGFDGSDVWIDDPDKQYEGDPVFYHNLMFYFYAMPFVLADDGIIYSETEDLVYGDRKYPGIGIGYQANIGTSPKDEYYIHYDPETCQMAWLGYTVTYRAGEKSDNVKWIRYGEWLEEEGILLPSSITWHNYEGRIIGEARSKVSFENVSLSNEAMEAVFFDKPETAKVATAREQ